MEAEAVWGWPDEGTHKMVDLNHLKSPHLTPKRMGMAQFWHPQKQRPTLHHHTEVSLAYTCLLGVMDLASRVFAWLFQLGQNNQTFWGILQMDKIHFAPTGTWFINHGSYISSIQSGVTCCLSAVELLLLCALVRLALSMALFQFENKRGVLQLHP